MYLGKKITCLVQIHYKIHLQNKIMLCHAEWPTKLLEGAGNATLQHYLPLTTVFLIRGK